MKKLAILIFLLVAVLVGSSSATQVTDLIVIDSPWIDSKIYADLNALVTGIGSSEETVLINRPESVTTLSIPANISLVFGIDGSINNSGRLNIHTTSITADNHQIFTGSGEVDFAVGTNLRSTWFSDLYTAFNVTNDNYVTLIINSGWAANVTASVAVGDNVTLKWEGAGNRIVINSGFTLSNIKNIDAGRYQLFGGSGDLDFAELTTLRTSWFKYLRTVIAWIETENVTLIVDKSHTVSTNLTITSNITFEPENGVIISDDASNANLVINGYLIAGPYQQVINWGTGTGSVTFGTGVANEYFPHWFGIAGSDDQAALTTFFAAVPSGSTIRFPSATYVLTGATTITSNNSYHIICDQGAFFDATASTADPVFVFTGVPGTYYALGGNITAGDRTFTANATLAASLSDGDIVKFTTDNALGGDGTLWNDSRAYYFKGEFAEVESVSGTTITVKNGFIDSYTIASTVTSRIAAILVTIENFRMTGNASLNSIGLYFGYGRNIKVIKGEITGFATSCLLLNNVVDTTISGFHASRFYTVAVGLDYGIDLTTVQNVDIENAVISGGRHAIAIGGREPSRYVTVSNSILDSDSQTTESALDAHANTQHIVFTNNIVKNCIQVHGRDTIIIDNLVESENPVDDNLIRWDPDGTGITSDYLVISGNTIRSNGTDYGIFIASQGGMTVKNVQINDNTISGVGEGIFVYQAQTPTFTITDLQIHDNIVASSDKGIYVSGFSAANKITVTNVSIQGNMITNSGTHPLRILNSNVTIASVIGNTIHNTHAAPTAPHFSTDNVIDVLLFNFNTVIYDNPPGTGVDADDVVEYLSYIGNYVKGLPNNGFKAGGTPTVQVALNHMDTTTGTFALGESTTTPIVNQHETESVSTSVALTRYGASDLDSSGGALALTLANGYHIGQTKTISMSVAGNNADVTIAKHETNDNEVARFDAVDEYWLGTWTGTEWATVSNSCTFP